MSGSALCGTAALGSPAREASSLPAILSSSQLPLLPAVSSSQHMIPENTPPSAVRSRRDASRPTEHLRDRTPASHAPRDDARARIRSEPECVRHSRCCLYHSRFERQTAPNPRPALEAAAHTLLHSQGCRTSATPRATEPHPHVPALCSARPTRIPTEAAPHAAKSRSVTFLSAEKMDTPHEPRRQNEF